MSTKKYTRKHYYETNKAAAPVHAESSYELRAVVLIDDNDDIVFFEDHQSFTANSGQKRLFDFLVTLKNGDKKIIEVKPKKRLDQFEEQIRDNREYAASKGWLFELWTEKELGFIDSKQITSWADEFIKERTGIDYAEVRRQKTNLKAKRYYRSKIANDTVTVFCAFCNEEHHPLRLTHDRNIARNGHYICEREGGHIAGSKPKTSLIKENPYASEGKKKCAGECGQILAFECFSPDNSKRNGYCSSCKVCRSAKGKKRYHENKQ